VTRLTAAVLVTAAVALSGVVASATVDRAVRAEVAIAGDRNPLDVRGIRIIDGLSPGESYRLPAFAIRNRRDRRTTYRLVVSADATQAGRRFPRHWLRLVPAAVVIDARRSRAVGAQLELPPDAEPGVYALVLGVRPGGSEGARLTFRVEPAESTRAWPRPPSKLGTWVLPAVVGAALVFFLLRIRA
jgi:hypothetical protein